MRHVLATAGGALLLGAALATPAAAAVELTHEATLDDGGYAEIRVSSGAELAGEQLSVLVLNEGAALDDPAAEDVVYVDQQVVDDDGAVELRVALPSGDLEGYWLAVNTTGGTERYVAPLDGVADEEPTVGPTEEPTGGPTDEPTGHPTEEPTGGATDEPTGGPTAGPTGGPADGGPGEEPSVGGVGDAGGDGPAEAGGGSGAGSAGDGGFLSRTGAPVALATAIALAGVAAGCAVLYLRRRAG